MISAPDDREDQAFSPEPRRVLLANPRGFCAGVRRAIAAVEDALHVHGAPVYVRHAIVHNRRVLKQLEELGAVFVEDVSEIPQGAVTILSAHGSAAAVKAQADKRGLRVVDAICPLVAKIHSEVAQWNSQGRHVLLVGHADHPEIIGTTGQLPPDAISIVADLASVSALPLPDETPVAYAVQTTFSVADSARLIEAIEARFSNCVGPRSSDICYATTNRQSAVTQIAPRCDIMLIVGDPTSSNARRLVEAALAADCPQAFLIEDTEDLAHIPLAKASTIGLSAAASAPDEAIEEICSWLDGLGFLREEMAGPEESIRFRPISVVTTEQAPPHLPKILADDRAAVDTVLMDAIGDCPTRNIRLADAMRYAATAGGKRFRAALALAVAEMLGGDRGSALRVAAAIECVHAQSLVHDDLPCMDDDDLRRGRPTVHRRFDEATAVLAGDALLALAFEILSDPRTHADAAVRSELVLGLAKCIGQDGLAGGQMMDLYPEADLSREGLIDCLNRKTGALVRFAVEAGMLLGRSNAQTRSALKSYATDLGLLFQLRDDLLDSEGDAAIVGKAVNKDKDKSRETGVTVLGAETTALEVEALLRACDSALEPFGISAARLRTLARFAARRDL